LHLVDRPQTGELEPELVAQQADEPAGDRPRLDLARQRVAHEPHERELLDAADERAARLAERAPEPLLLHLHQAPATASHARSSSASRAATTRSRSRAFRPRRSQAAGAIAGIRRSPPKP